MFATLSSFLPSALQQGSPNPANVANKDVPPPVKPEVPKPREVVSTDEGSARRKERRINHESFIVVRPPPSMSNHPLNLQVQLVPPQARDRDRTRSMDISPTSMQDQEDNTLTRTTSNRSDVSMYSGYSSVTSFTSVASTSTASSRRMIIPLYNLQAHNVMTNLIVDAGTDAKVAKFQRRGLEILGLAVIEPVEVFGSNTPYATQILPSSNRTSIDEHHDLTHHLSPWRGGTDGIQTPSSSAHSLSSAGMDTSSPSAPTITRADINSTPTGGPKKLFGKFFKKKDSQPSSPSASLALSSPTGGPLHRPRQLTAQSLAPPQGTAKRNSWLGPTASGQRSEMSTSPTSSIPAATSHLQPAVLGIQPSSSSPTYPPHGRPHSYTWVVRRWIKGSHESLLGNVIGQRQSRTPTTEEGAVDVHFVWSRGKKKKKLRDGSQQVGANRRTSMAGSPSKKGSGSSFSRSRTIDHGVDERRLSTASGHSVSTGSEMGSAAGPAYGGGNDDDDGDESDPEDSETPWTCTLVLSRRPGGAGGTSGSADGLVRVRVATFSPTPHHPKVVALLKVPFPLPDIVVDRLQVCRRAVTAQGIARPSWHQVNGVDNGGAGAGAPEGLVLTAEEIKDVVSSTGLWLVVRENIGGVGKINRKGDGWRIRA
ncbi:hypothetical protein BJV74DRAFT_888542 [Russula compacta]|nr:hypothetical protein BJV74DRAFT_888542 [Russula compacta]